jgi:hypothetical protein
MKSRISAAEPDYSGRLGSAVAARATLLRPPLANADKAGVWVALDNCRYDQATLQPIEGDIVDSDEDLAELCGRMRAAGRTSCAIFFCERDIWVQTTTNA